MQIYCIHLTIKMICRLSKRETASVETDKNILDKIKDEVDKDVDLVADKTGMKGWQVLAIFILVAVGLIVFIGWCVWRFCRKKRRGKSDIKAGEVGADTADDKDDLQALVTNEEEDLNQKPG